MPIEKKNHIVSVILPTYNRAQLVCEAIESVLSQTYPYFEIIVVDDGSTDYTSEVLEKYKDKIIYIYQENKGPGDARNRGITEAKGNYIAFLDSDDIWFDHKLELQVAIMEKIPDIGFLSSDFCILKKDGENIHYGLRTWHKNVIPWRDIYEKSIRYSSLNLSIIAPERDFDIFIGNLYYPLLIEPYVLPSSAMVRRECIGDDARFAEGIFLYEDWEFFAKLSRNYDAAFLNIETVYNRGHSDEARLTHCGIAKHAVNRLGLIERVWKSDKLFSKRYSDEIKKIEGEQLLILIKEFLFESQPKVAREYINRWWQLGMVKDRFKIFLFMIFAWLPGGCRVLIITRNIRHLIIPGEN
jgi:glycosyltransferase involved in cell wall biosynthesis